MASVEEGIAAQIRNIEARYGRPLPEWFGIIHRVRVTSADDLDDALAGRLAAAYAAAG